MIVKDLVESSFLTDVDVEEAANVKGGLGLLTEQSIFTMVGTQHQLNTNGFTHIAGYGKVYPSKYPGYAYSPSHKKYVPFRY